MFVKLVLFAALVMIVITLVKRGKHNSHNNSDNNSMPINPELDKSMKRCAQCGVHLPDTEALAYQTLHFCCNDHKKTYLEDKEV